MRPEIAFLLPRISHPDELDYHCFAGDLGFRDLPEGAVAQGDGLVSNRSGPPAKTPPHSMVAPRRPTRSGMSLRVNAVYNARLVFTLDLDEAKIESIELRSLSHIATGLALERAIPEDWEEIYERTKEIIEGDPITLHWNGSD